MVLRKEISLQIKNLLKEHPQGLRITDIIKKVKINRNTAGRYLENMLVSGQVEMRRFGMAKIYSLSQRVPLSALLSISSELVLQLDNSLRVIYANEPFLLLVGTDSKNLSGKNIEFTPIALVFEDFFTEFIENLRDGVQGKEWSGEIFHRSKNITWFCRIAPTVFDDGRKGVSVILEDITERKFAESSLHESEDRFRKLVEISPDGVFIHQHGKIIFINEAALKIFGASQPEDIIGKFVLDLIHPDFRETVRKNIEKDLSGEITPPLELHLLRSDGVPIIVEGRGVKTTIDGIPAVQVAIRDITDRKRIEMELRESEAKYRTFIDRANDGIVVVQDGIIKICNRSIIKFWGGSINEIVGKNFMEFIRPDVLPDIVNRYKQRISGENIPPLYETILKRKDGSSFFAELNAGLISFEGKTADLIIIRDINERKKIEERLRKSEDLYRTLAEASNDLIFVIDRDDRVEYVNSYAAAIMNKTVGQIIGSPRHILFPPQVAKIQKKSLETVFETGTSIKQEGPLTFAGQTHWFDHVLSPLRDADNNIRSVLGISRDITERKTAEIALRESEATARALLNAPTDSVLVIDDQGVILAINEITASRFGKRIDELVGTLSYDLLPKEVAQLRQSLMAPVLEKNEMVRFVDERAGRWYDTVVYPILNEKGEGKKLAIIARDITEQKTFEKRLRESEQKYKRLLEQTFDAIAIHKEGKIAFLNDRAAKILGAARPEDLMGKSIFEFIHMDSRKDLEDRLQKLTGEQVTSVPVIPEKFIRTDGSTVNVEVLAISFDDNGTPAVQVAFREISPCNFVE